MMLTSYTIDSDFGVFEAAGNAMLMCHGNLRDREAAGGGFSSSASFDLAESSIRSALTRENIMIP
jgi:hypothetical protein